MYLSVCVCVRVVADSLMIEESLLLQNKSGLSNFYITWQMCVQSTRTGKARKKAKVCQSQEQINMQLNIRGARNTASVNIFDCRAVSFLWLTL